MPPKRPLEEDFNSDDEIHKLTRLTTESQQIAPRKRNFHDVQPMTQYLSQSRDISADPELATDEFTERAGYIKQIKLTNFMCHANFTLRLGPRLNFIVGNNGSGKSAILTAITIGLGAKATTTNRGTSLKDLIKQGCNSSKIQIVLCNEGINSYEQHIYGKEIRIERTLKREGTSGSFSIRSENNKEVSSKKRDLDAILDYFSIPVMNPMCFLSQDAARSFLTASSSQEKYLHFMKGTLLEETKQNLEAAEGSMLSSKTRLSLLEESVRHLHEDYKQAETLLNELVSKNDWISRRRLLQGKHMWVVYKSNREKARILEKKKNALQVKKQEYLDRISDTENKIERYLIQKEEAVKDVSFNLTERQKIEAERSSLQIEIDKYKRQHTQLKQQEKIAQEDLQTSESAYANIISQIEAAESELRKKKGGDEESIRSQIDEIKLELSEIKDKMPKLHEDQHTLDQEEGILTRERKKRINDLEKSITEMRQEYNELRSSEDKLAHAFDRRMPMVRQMINRRIHEFSSPPIGPIGYHVKVKSGYEDFAFLIQTHINSTLGAFVVNNSRDELLLKKIFDACQLRKTPAVITHQLQSFDYSRGKATAGTTISDVLNYDMPELEYLLVDLNRIEKTVLVKNKSEGDRILRHQRPRNLNLVLASRDNSSGLHMSLSGGSGMRLNVVTFANTLRIKLGDDNDLSFLEKKITYQIRELKKMRADFTEKINKIRSEKKGIEGKLTELPRTQKKLSRKLEELEDSLNGQTDTSRLEALKESLKEYEIQIQQLKANLASFDEKFGDLGLQLEPAKQKYDDVTRRYQEAMAAYENSRNLEISISNKIDKCRAVILETQRKISVNNEKTQICEEELNHLLSKCDEQFQQANAFCTEAEIANGDLPEDESEILREIKRIDESVRASERQLGMTHENIIKLFESAKTKYEGAIEKYNELDDSLQKIYNALMLRRAALELSVKGTCTDADIDFRTSMKTRSGYSGSLSFKVAGQLNVMVQTMNDTSPRNVDTLSGGEKSFSQIALLLATWLTMRSRIIALDEFDVFMDQVNRKIGTDLIIRRLGKDVKSDTQTIIITPQDIGKMANIDEQFVNIHRIRNPERHVQTDNI